MTPLIPQSSTAEKPARRSLKRTLRNGLLAFGAAAAFATPQSSEAMRIICDMNTLPLAQYTTVSALHEDGCWLVFNNNPSTSQVDSVITNLGTGIIVAENIYPGLYNYNLATSSGHRPTAAFSYHETGGTVGGTILTNAEITNLKGQISTSSIVVLTRGYTGGWVTPLNTALANASVSGVAFEIAPYYGNGNNDDIKLCIDYCVAHGKDCYLLFANTQSSGPTYYTQLRSEFQDLLERGAKLYDDHVILAFGNYASQSSAWTGSEGDNSAQAGKIWADNQDKFMHQYYFKNTLSNLVMDVNAASTAAGATIDQFTNKSGTNQQFFFLYGTGNHYVIENLNSKKFVGVVGGSSGVGIGIEQQDLSGTIGNNAQLWTPQSTGTNWVFYNATAAKMLDCNHSTTTGTQLVTANHDGNAGQIWTLVNVN